MTTGRPPKPTALKVLHGDRKDRINQSEPQGRPAGSLEPPKGLARRGKALWRRLAGDMATKGVVTDWDLELLQQYCEAVHQAEDAADDLHRNGTAVTTLVRETAKGDSIYELRKNPNYQVWRDAVALMVTLGGQLGLTPAARSKITTKTTDANKAAGRLLS